MSRSIHESIRFLLVTTRTPFASFVTCKIFNNQLSVQYWVIAIVCLYFTLIGKLFLSTLVWHKFSNGFFCLSFSNSRSLWSIAYISSFSYLWSSHVTVRVCLWISTARSLELPVIIKSQSECVLVFTSFSTFTCMSYLWLSYHSQYSSGTLLSSFLLSYLRLQSQSIYHYLDTAIQLPVSHSQSVTCVTLVERT